MAGRVADARTCAATVHKVQPDYGIDDFLQGFRMDAEGEALLRKAAAAMRP
jgi:hypothetical protein